MTVIAVTGHRPDRLGEPLKVQRGIHSALVELGVEQLIQGMADGADLLSAQVANNLGVSVIGVSPWRGHSLSVKNKMLYAEIADNLYDHVVLEDSMQFPGNWAYWNRNKYMVDRADIVLAIWDGKPGGGTAGTVAYAVKTGKPVYRVTHHGVFEGVIS